MNYENEAREVLNPVAFPFDWSSEMPREVTGEDQRRFHHLALGGRILEEFVFDGRAYTFYARGAVVVSGAFADFSGYELDLSEVPHEFDILVCRMNLTLSTVELLATDLPEPRDVVVADLSYAEAAGWTIAPREKMRSIESTSGAITGDMLPMLPAGKIGAGLITSAMIRDGAVTNAKIVANTIARDRLAARAVGGDRVGSIASSALFGNLRTGNIAVPANAPAITILVGRLVSNATIPANSRVGVTVRVTGCQAGYLILPLLGHIHGDGSNFVVAPPYSRVTTAGTNDFTINIINVRNSTATVQNATHITFVAARVV